MLGESVKNKNMDIIFIDTSVFEENNFLESHRINQILKLGEERYIKIILPEITKREIVNRLRKNVTDAVVSFKKYRDGTRILRNAPSLNEKFEPINEAECILEIENIITERFNIANIEIIEYPTLNIGIVFSKYFNKELPFSEGIKKNEFPDAFALVTVEEWCKKNKKTCIVFAKDNDIIKYNSDLIQFVDYEKYLSTKLEEVETLKQRNQRLVHVKNLFNNDKEDIISKVKDWVSYELDDENTYLKYTNYHEIHDIEIGEIEVVIEDFQITSISDSAITLECITDIAYFVEITYDDENDAMYDDEEKVWHYYSTKTDRIEDSKSIYLTLKYEIPPAGEQFAELLIEEINEGRDLNIESAWK